MAKRGDPLPFGWCMDGYHHACPVSYVSTWYGMGERHCICQCHNGTAPQPQSLPKRKRAGKAVLSQEVVDVLEESIQHARDLISQDENFKPFLKED